MDNSKKHYIGFVFLFIFIIFYYSFSIITFNIVNFASVFVGCLFLVIYISMLIFMVIYFQKNDLLLESKILCVLCFTLTNPYFLSLIYYLLILLFESTNIMETIDKIFEMLVYPFNVFYTAIPWIIMIISPIIPLISLIILSAKRKKQSKTDKTEDGSVS